MALAKSPLCHYGMAHGFHLDGLDLFEGENWK